MFPRASVSRSGVRCDEVETIEFNRDKGIGITVYVGQRKGYASTSDFSAQALRETVEAALDIARFTAEDDCAGLADAVLMAKDCPDLDLYHPWALTVEDAIETARRCEQAAFDASPLVSNSEGASVSTQQAHFVSANSLGFMGGYPTSRHYISCSVIAGEQDAMQRDDWYTTRRCADELDDPALRRAHCRSARRGPPRRAQGQDRRISGAVRGAARRRPARRPGACGQWRRALSQILLPARPSRQARDARVRQHQRAPAHQTRPRQLRLRQRRRRDQDREVVSGGILQGYFLSAYTARKLGMQTTGNAGGSHNLIIEPGALDLDGLLKQMNRGLLVTELLGHGINYVTGDYSRGAAGYWVENGRIAYPVEEITIAGNLKAMLLGIAAVGNDVQILGSKQTGSILVDRMTVAGE